MYDYTELVSYIVRSIVSKPDDVTVMLVEGDRTNRVEVRLAAEDVGKVIGRGGRNLAGIEHRQRRFDHRP